jgi:hypothetical protein
MVPAALFVLGLPITLLVALHAPVRARDVRAPSGRLKHALARETPRPHHARKKTSASGPRNRPTPPNALIAPISEKKTSAPWSWTVPRISIGRSRLSIRPDPTPPTGPGTAPTTYGRAAASSPATGNVTSAVPTDGISDENSVSRPKKIGLGARAMKKPMVAMRRLHGAGDEVRAHHGPGDVAKLAHHRAHPFGRSGVERMNQSISSRPSRSRKKNAISISASFRLKRPSIASAPDTAPSAQRPPAATRDLRAVDSLGSSAPAGAATLRRIGGLRDQPLDSLRWRWCLRTTPIDAARFVNGDRRDRGDRDQDQDDGRGREQRGAERAPAAHPADRRFVERRQHAGQHRGDQQRPPERKDDRADEQRGRADHTASAPPSRHPIRHSSNLSIGRSAVGCARAQPCGIPVLRCAHDVDAGACCRSSDRAAACTVGYVPPPAGPARPSVSGHPDMTAGACMGDGRVAGQFRAAGHRIGKYEGRVARVMLVITRQQPGGRSTS